MADAVESTPVKVYDISGPQPIPGTLDPSEVGDALASGKFSLPKNGAVSVVSPEGELGTISPKEVPQALEAGYQYATPEMQNQINFGTGKEQLKAGLEGFGEGLAGPLSPLIETKVFGVKPENIRARADVNPGTNTLGKVAGLGAGILTGTGEAALLETGGKAAANALKLGGEGAGIASQIGAHAARAATEMALLSSGDEVSKMILNDPHQSLETAVSNIGLSTLLGGAGGAALGSVAPLWKATAGEKAAQFIEDYKGRLQERLNNPDPLSALTKEIGDYHQGITGLNDKVWGPVGVKAQAIDRLMPEMTESIRSSTNELAERLSSEVAKMREAADVFPSRLVSQYEGQVNRVLEAVTDPNATPGKIFDAVQTTKQWAQDASKSAWKYGSFDPEYKFVQKVNDLSKTLRPFLEDSKVWGEVGAVQQKINAAASKFFPTLQDFESKFATKIGGERIIDPGKINTFYNQIGKPNAEIKREVLENFFKASEKYRTEVSDAYAKIGMDSPFQHSSLNQVSQVLKELSPGARAADVLVNRGLANVGGKSVGAAVGAGVGALVGHPYIGGLVGEHALGSFFSTVLPSIIKPMLDRAASSEGLKAAAEYGVAIAKGETLLNKSMKALFKPGAEVIPPRMLMTDKERGRLDERVKFLASNPDKLMDVGGHSSYYLPNHAGAMGETSGRVVQYLNSIRPKVEKTGALDSNLKPSKMETAQYNRALEIAEQPLVVLDSVKNGSVTHQDVVHLKSMYPSLYNKMAAQMTYQISEHAGDGNSIPYKTRLGMSLFLNEPLDSTMKAPSIQTTQAAFMPSGQAPQAPQPKRSLNSLSKETEMYQTPQQSRVQSKNRP